MAVTYAGFWRRAGGYAVDWLIYGLVAWLVAAASAPAWMWWLFLAANEVGLGAHGGTAGMRALGLRLADLRDGTDLGFARAGIRAVSEVLSALALFVGYLWMLDHPRRQTWHDIVAGSVVVRERRMLDELSPEWAADWAHEHDERRQDDGGWYQPVGGSTPPIGPT